MSIIDKKDFTFSKLESVDSHQFFIFWDIQIGKKGWFALNIYLNDLFGILLNCGEGHETMYEIGKIKTYQAGDDYIVKISDLVEDIKTSLENHSKNFKLEAKFLESLKKQLNNGKLNYGNVQLTSKARRFIQLPPSINF